MNVTNVYTKKEYTCQKCKNQIYYGQITDDAGKIITKDGSKPNGKYGKESNILSGSVDKNNKKKFRERKITNIICWSPLDFISLYAGAKKRKK